MNHYTHLYGSTVININRVRSMVNLTLEARVRYLLYTVIYCKQVHYTTNSLVWGLLRFTPIKDGKVGGSGVSAGEDGQPETGYTLH